MINNIIISGGIFHDYSSSSEALAKILEPLNIRSIIYTDIEKGLSDLATDESQLLTINALRWRMLDKKYDPYRSDWGFHLSEAGRNIIKNHVQNGNGLLAMHAASICFDDWPEWKAILGGAWSWGKSTHPPLGGVDVEVVCEDAVVNGCLSFKVNDEVYSELDLEPSIKPLLVSGAMHASPGQPLLWKHTYGKGRVIYDALGHDAISIEEATHQRVIQQSVKWLLKC